MILCMAIKITVASSVAWLREQCVGNGAFGMMGTSVAAWLGGRQISLDGMGARMGACMGAPLRKVGK